MVLSSFVGSGIIKVYSVRSLSLFSVLDSNLGNLLNQIQINLVKLLFRYHFKFKKKKVICEIRKIL